MAGLKFIAMALFWAYALVFLFGGLGGLAGAREEMGILFAVDLHDKAPEAAASILNQYRFLRGAEAGLGLFLIVLRKEIWSQRRVNLVFLFTMFAAPTARAVSLVRDGWPYYPWVILMLVEFSAFAVFLIHSRRSVWTKPAEPPAPELPAKA